MSQHQAHIAIILEDGTIAIDTFSESPLVFNQGDGSLEAAIESLILEGPAGEEIDITIAPGQLFPEHNSDMVHSINRDTLPDTLDKELTEGQIISFETPTGEEIGGIVLSYNNDMMEVDFNHPLSGKILQLKYKLIS